MPRGERRRRLSRANPRQIIIPRTSRLAADDRIAAMTALRRRRGLDPRADKKGIGVGGAETDTLHVTARTCHPAWNDTIMPRQPP